MSIEVCSAALLFPWFRNVYVMKGADVPSPIKSFSDLKSLGVLAQIIENIEKSGYDSPTNIQVLDHETCDDVFIHFFT